MLWWGAGWQAGWSSVPFWCCWRRQRECTPSGDPASCQQPLNHGLLPLCCSPCPHQPHPTPPPPAICCLAQVVIHPAIQPKDATAMTEEAHAAIASSLPPELVAPPEEEVGSSVDSS